MFFAQQEKNNDNKRTIDRNSNEHLIVDAYWSEKEKELVRNWNHLFPSHNLQLQTITKTTTTTTTTTKKKKQTQKKLFSIPIHSYLNGKVFIHSLELFLHSISVSLLSQHTHIYESIWRRWILNLDRSQFKMATW